VGAAWSARSTCMLIVPQEEAWSAGWSERQPLVSGGGKERGFCGVGCWRVPQGSMACIVFLVLIGHALCHFSEVRHVSLWVRSFYIVVSQPLTLGIAGIV
jgi:hypothetical protein